MFTVSANGRLFVCRKRIVYEYDRTKECWTLTDFDDYIKLCETHKRRLKFERIYLDFETFIKLPYGASD